MAEFFPAFANVLIEEGIYSDDSTDRGGETKYGISSRTFPDEDIAGMTGDRTKTIYDGQYWNAIRGDEIKSQDIASKLFSIAVNAGPETAAKIAQRAMTFLGVDLVVDGVAGPVTISALNQYRDRRALIAAIKMFQMEHYRQIIERDSTQSKYANGWMRRADR